MISNPLGRGSVLGYHASLLRYLERFGSAEKSDMYMLCTLEGVNVSEARIFPNLRGEEIKRYLLEVFTVFVRHPPACCSG